MTFSALPKAPPPPATPKNPVVDEYHGQKITDDYRWLENWDDPAVRQWSDAQNARARALLDKLPNRDAIEARITGLLSWQSPIYSGLRYRGGRLFVLKMQPPKQQPFIVQVGSLQDTSREKVLVDPNAIDPSGGTSIDFYEPSLDGRYLAVSLSKGGTESGDLHLFEVESGRELSGDTVPRVNSGTAGGSIAWNGDGTGFWYTRHPAPGERPKEDLGFYQQVWFHKLGTPVEKDVYALGRTEFPRIAETELHTSPDGRHVVAVVQKGDGGEYEVFLLDVKKKSWTKLATWEDGIKHAEFGLDGALWALSRKDAPRGKIVRIPLDTPTLDKAQVVVPEGEANIVDFELTPKMLYVVEQLGGPSRLRRFELTGALLGAVKTLPVSAVSGVERYVGDDVLYTNVSFIEPRAVYRFDAVNDATVRTAMAQTSAADFSDAEVVREEAVSKDGARVPLSIIKPKKLKLNGKNPALLTGYGGFNIPITPSFNPLVRVWLDQGGVYAVANLRGGGEFGEAWHQAGAKTQKQHVFDDFLACAKHLVQRKYTSANKLAIEGGSNGGLLMGAAMTQAPKQFGAVVAHVGYFDMLRYETRPNGAFNNTEYGSVKDEAEFKALWAYSPYHHVQKGTKYPPALFMTGANDPRVDPLHSRKMVAQLQAAGAPAFLRTSAGTGHGGGTPLSGKIAEAVDGCAFMFAALGVPWKMPPPAPKPSAP
ncbi:MAG: S9 family peptidase [Myxococcaceae bacterium]|nr:S9 family peptidase [Myxococcaceae bacterium]